MKKINILRLAVIIFALAFILAGVLREEHLVVFRKAASICLECIGIG